MVEFPSLLLPNSLSLKGPLGVQCPLLVVLVLPVVLLLYHHFLLQLNLRRVEALLDMKKGTDPAPP